MKIEKIKISKEDRLKIHKTVSREVAIEENIGRSTLKIHKNKKKYNRKKKHKKKK